MSKPFKVTVALSACQIGKRTKTYLSFSLKAGQQSPTMGSSATCSPDHELSGLMVSCIGPLATINREPRQARKGAAAAVDSGAGMWLV